MAFTSAHSGPPPGTHGSVIQPCPNPHGYLCIVVVSARQQNTPALANTDVRITVGDGQAQDLTTDAQGRVTFVFDSANDFANVPVRVTLRDAARAWVGQTPTNNLVATALLTNGQTATACRVPVAGKFTLRVRVTTRRPGANADIRWRVAWNATSTVQLRRATTPDGGVAGGDVDTNLAASGDDPPVVQLEVADLDCVSSHDLCLRQLNGIVDADSETRVHIDGVDAVQTAVDVAATQGNVTFSRPAATTLRLEVQRHGAVVTAEFFVQFKRMLIVGEGTSFEYAVGLAEKYGDAGLNRGFRWVVATQYDVIAPNAVSNDMRILRWSDGTALVNQNQRQNVTNAIARNLVNHGVQFDATNVNHWNGLATYGEFDLSVFNNPHVGYGMHMCVVMGLTRWQNGGDAAAQRSRRFANKNGMAVSVYSIGYGHALNRGALNSLLGTLAHRAAQATVESRGRQRLFVRTNNAGCLNHRNTRDTAIPCQYDPAHTTALNLTVRQAFRYESNRGQLSRRYGDDDEFNDNTVRTHYTSFVDTIGLQGYLLRCYRYYGQRAIKTGGKLYINGSAHWNDTLTADFVFDDGGDQDVDAMQYNEDWDGHETFVHYNTNFTSNDHHPSWYSQWNFNPGHPGLANARVYEWTKP